jgi:hypothetical protein
MNLLKGNTFIFLLIKLCEIIFFVKKEDDILLDSLE